MKKIISLFLSVLLLFSSLVTNRAIFAEEGDDTGFENSVITENMDGDYEEETPAEEERLLSATEDEIEKAGGDIGDFIPKDIRTDYLKDDTDPSIFHVNSAAKDVTDYPSAFDLRNYGYVSSVKSQGNYGTCWVHAALASAESSYLKNYGEELDLSELQVAYFAYHNEGIADALDLITEDSFSNRYESSKGLLNGGGNGRIASMMIATGIGIVDEEDMPYPHNQIDEETFVSEIDTDYCYQKNKYLLKDAKWIDPADSDTIKYVLMNYGAIETSYLSVTTGIKLEDGTIYYASDFYNSATKAYYNYAVSGTNHAVTIVGWDDDFDKNNFPTAPENNGAWLIKNSWGTWWGDNGYFWLSYEDKGFLSSDALCQFEIEKAPEGAKEYQYDGTYPVSYYGFSRSSFSEANIYTAQAKEKLYRVAYATQTPGIRCTVSVYTDIGSSPDDGTLVATKSATETYAGMHTLDLDDIVRLNPGQSFSVVVKQETTDSEIYCPFTTTATVYWMVAVDQTETGQSFLKSGPNSSWEDMGSNNMTMIIKAYTYADINHICYHNASESEHENPATYTTGCNGGSIALNDAVREGYEFLGWYLDEDFNEQIVEIDTNDPMDYDLYARWEIIEYDITYDLNGGTGNNPEHYTVESDIVLQDAFKEYYDFVGWFTEDGEHIERIEAGNTGDLTLYAHYVPHEYLITYDLKGGTTERDNPVTYNIESDDIVLVNPSRKGYVFTGWTGTDLEEPAMQVVIPQGSVSDRSYEAHYEPCDYSITYVLNDSDDSPASHDNPNGYRTGDEDIVLRDGERKGYLFAGWYLNEGFDDRIETIRTDEACDIVVYASWEPIRYTVVLDYGGIKEENDSFEFLYDEKYHLLFVEDSDYEFLGWSDVSGGEKKFDNGDEVMNLSFIEGSTVVLYALWDYKYRTETPYADPDGSEEIDRYMEVSLYCDTPGATIYYTTDGTAPSRLSYLYEEPIVIAEDTVVRAFAVSDKKKDSYEARFVFTVRPDDFGDITEEDKESRGIVTEEDIPKGIWTSALHDFGYDPSVKSYCFDTDELRVYYGKKLLSPDNDYTLKYAQNSKAGAASLIITGKGKYQGSLSVPFRIRPVEAGNGILVVLNSSTFTYNKKIQKPSVTVTYGQAILKAGTDYALSYPDSYEDRIAYNDPGTYNITVSFKGNYQGELNTSYEILEKDTYIPVSAIKITGIRDYPYTGEEIMQEDLQLSYTANKTTVILEENKDYSLSYRDNTESGTAYVVIEGKGDYAGTLYRSFKITPLAFTGKTITVQGINASYDYTGKTIRPEPIVSVGEDILSEGTDYTTAWKNNVNAGTATITFTGIGNYKGSFSKSFKINRQPITDQMFVFKESYDYTKGGVKPLPDASFNNKKLTLNKDYTLTYRNNGGTGEASVTIKGKGNFTGVIEETFTIVPKDIGKTEVLLQDKVCSEKAEAWKSLPSLKDSDGKTLGSGTDYEKDIVYTYRYSTYVQDGSVKEKPKVLRNEGETVRKNDILQANTIINVKVKGTGNYTGTKEGSYRIVDESIAKATVSIGVQYYTGKPVVLSKADIKVKLGKTVLSSSDYDIVSYSNNTDPGTATVTIRGKGHYGGSKTVSFKIRQRSLGITVRFLGNGATSGSMKDQLIYKEAALNKNAYKREEVIDGVKKTYRFLGWSVNPDGPVDYTDRDGYDYSLSEAGRTIELYAIWE
ncbi:MAG: InlB B-repeat-containing protein [Erysipelotrichaceae bacterium]|nr:InlB B-repeat-containing protein [Erysipelotrichaceae bacterium]